jgi:hypothetical protein
VELPAASPSICTTSLFVVVVGVVLLRGGGHAVQGERAHALAFDPSVLLDIACGGEIERPLAIHVDSAVLQRLALLPDRGVECAGGRLPSLGLGERAQVLRVALMRDVGVPPLAVPEDADVLTVLGVAVAAHPDVLPPPPLLPPRVGARDDTGGPRPVMDALASTERLEARAAEAKVHGGLRDGEIDA